MSTKNAIAFLLVILHTCQVSDRKCYTATMYYLCSQYKNNLLGLLLYYLYPAIPTRGFAGVISCSL